MNLTAKRMTLKLKHVLVFDQKTVIETPTKQHATIYKRTNNRIAIVCVNNYFFS